MSPCTLTASFKLSSSEKLHGPLAMHARILFHRFRQSLLERPGSFRAIAFQSAGVPCCSTRSVGNYFVTFIMFVLTYSASPLPLEVLDLLLRSISDASWGIVRRGSVLNSCLRQGGFWEQSGRGSNHILHFPSHVTPSELMHAIASRRGVMSKTPIAAKFPQAPRPFNHNP